MVYEKVPERYINKEKVDISKIKKNPLNFITIKRLSELIEQKNK